MDAVRPGRQGDVMQVLREVEDAFTAVERCAREMRYWSDAVLFPGVEPVFSAVLKGGFAPSTDDVETGDTHSRWCEEWPRRDRARDVRAMIRLRLERTDLTFAAAFALALAILGIALAAWPRPLLVSQPLVNLPTSAETVVLVSRTREAGRNYLVGSRHDALALIRTPAEATPPQSQSFAPPPAL